MVAKTAVIAIVAVAVVVAAGVGVGVLLMNQNNGDNRDAVDVAKDVIKAINDTNSDQKTEFVELSDNTKDVASISSDDPINSRSKYVTISKVELKDKYDAGVADSDFNTRYTGPTFIMMKKTVTSNKIDYKEGLTDGKGYWYVFGDSYAMIEYVGYNDSYFIHMKVEIDNTSITADDVQNIVKAAIGKL
ncbi:MAG: hypothetical protein J5813_03605 [Candidatus Methanomethylophilaceae archaeon]|nr:hypothetical protein [Candidatus Methanomethylophilaceae archaeon]